MHGCGGEEGGCVRGEVGGCVCVWWGGGAGPPFPIEIHRKLIYFTSFFPQYRSATYVAPPQQYSVQTGNPGFYTATNPAEYGAYGKRLCTAVSLLLNIIHRASHTWLRVTISSHGEKPPTGSRESHV